jgi:hypothetical protein
VLHFENNQNPSHRAYPDYDSLWKRRRIFSYLNNKHSTINHPTENLALDEVIVKLKGRVVFWQYTPKKHKRYGMKLYKLCDGNGYMCNMTTYLGEQLLNAAFNIMPIHGTVLQLKMKMQGVGHILFMDNHFFIAATVFRRTQWEYKLFWHSSPQQAGHANRLWAKETESLER